ncbi:serine/threonine protein kinase [Streptomyces sp. NBC_00249]|uniref:serine/threonine-protein kinase n=1 Tax=Streptomyces sp. NBC_00249 TaxID=2975690 RepID=UPI002259A154|nr:serine/threonine-protein kinase [Streptomyces sp. NBC_00249]MCX5192854.1 serine/threonine protein kinase [Streptomyces sp. NBC_00249]
MPERLPGTPPAPAALSADDPYEIGGYRLHARLGSGGMGVVYLAYTPGGRPIALKAVRREFAADPEFRERFAQEVASARRIHGLFTAQVVDSGADDRTPWLATAYVPGPSLDEVVRRHGPLPVRTVLLLVAGIAEALHAIHRAGVVHRDLKPANVLVAGDGPRVIDFGIARAADAAALTGTGLRIGTAAFMAPEQALGHQVTPATDVFALGTLVAYVAGGVPPFGGGPESSALYRVVPEHPDLARVPGDLHGLIAWCLAKRPEDRPTTVQLIESVHAHPLVGPRPEFTDGWLPHPVREEVGVRPAPAHLQQTRAATAPAPPGPGSHLPAAPAPAPVRVPPPAQAPASGRRAPGPGRRRLPVVALAVAGTLLACAGAVYYLDAPEGEEEDPGASPAPSRSAPPTAPGFVPGYAKARLTAPDPGYEFDLKAGKVVPAETATWYLARDGQAFVPSQESDAFVSDTGEPGPADCVRGIETRPAATLPFTALSKARPFCVRSPDRSEIAIVRLAEAAADGSVTIVVDQYRRG